MLVQEGKVAFPRWDDVVRDDLVLVEEGNLAHCGRGKASMSMLAFPHDAMMLSEMNSCLCKRES